MCTNLYNFVCVCVCVCVAGAAEHLPSATQRVVGGATGGGQVGGEGRQEVDRPPSSCPSESSTTHHCTCSECSMWQPASCDDGSDVCCRLQRG